MTYHTETTVLRGLPVTIGWEYAPREPDVGFPGGVDDWWIELIAGRKTKTEWLTRKIEADPKELDRLINNLLSDRNTWSREYE